MAKDPADHLTNPVGRDSKLRGMGFKSYQAYLASGLWAGIRERVMERDKWTCRTCGRRASQAHHTRYGWKDLEGKSLDHIVALCGRCHLRIEFSWANGKRAKKGTGAVLSSYRAMRRREKWRRWQSKMEEREVSDPLTAEFQRRFGDRW